MKLNVIMMSFILILFSCGNKAKTTQKAVELKTDTIVYKTYTNDQFGYQVKYPEFLLAQGESGNKDGQKFKSNNGELELWVYRAFKIDMETFEVLNLETAFKRDLEGKDIIENSLGSDKYYIKNLNGKTIELSHTFLIDETYYVVLFIYPQEKDKVIAKIVNKVVESFKKLSDNGQGNTEKKSTRNSKSCEKLVLIKETAQEKLKTLTPEQANTYFDELQKEVDGLVGKVNEEEENYLSNYYLYHTDNEGNMITPPDSIQQKEAFFKKAGLIFSYDEGEVALGLSTNFHKTLFSDKLTADYNAYLKLQDLIGDAPLIQDASLAIPIQKLADIILEYEAFLETYPKSMKVKEVKEYYKFYQELYLSGIDNSPVRDENNRLLQDVEQEFKRFVKNYPKSQTTVLVEEVLNKNK